ncbi:SDR family oxidoreductase [Nocardioides cavernae]|uniref:SDR family oxidoreductase n=1 Tax=Nocardioides cavernae TaxID=1921566 RepID=A0ABR8N7W9_9ACTN|nr:SDR family oxidoreductase [Nocardioides cavernae]MBD3924251.1 SDR family oxidoreductase [Nocardioides cavernae]MBM7510810.1 NAD(P)-dependent dehydrogenase (short-subunit alcohol dehydrogenase family) [Nocardioides cavernae]
MPRSFHGRLALVTGAGSGIGRATAQQIAAEGAALACTDIDLDAAQETASLIEAEGGVSRAFALDVTLEEQVAGTMDEAQQWSGLPLTVLVANAGVAGPVGDVSDLNAEAWDVLVNVNLSGPLYCAKHAVRRMRAAGGGAIVFTASHAAFANVPNWTPYAATKGGVVSLARGLAVDHAPDGIRVNCVCPGPIETPLLKGGWQQATDDPEHKARTRGRTGTPEELARVVAFLASDEAALVNGAALVADAGALAHMGTSWPSSSYWD